MLQVKSYNSYVYKSPVRKKKFLCLQFVERRRAALERFMNRTAAHPILRTDPDFREFLEQEADLPKSNQTSALSSRNMMKLINKVGDSLSNMTIKMEETDDW